MTYLSLSNLSQNPVSGYYKRIMDGGSGDGAGGRKYMSVGVMEDYKLRDLRASHTLVGRKDWRGFFFLCRKPREKKGKGKKTRNMLPAEHLYRWCTF
jgi:hypothetical protein